MPAMFGLLILIVPALIALAAIGGVVALVSQLPKAADGARVGLWILIVVLAGVAFGIGGCYAWVFTGNLRVGG